MHRLTIFSVLVLALVSSPAGALVNGQAPADEDTRFDAVCAFSRTQWLTVNEQGKGGHNWFGAGVLVAPDVVLIARHLLPPQVLTGEADGKGQFTVRFRRHADGTLGSFRAGPTSYHQVPVARWVLAKRSDLALGILAAPVEHIQPVRVLLEDSEILERKCILAGWGSESPWRGLKVPRRGLKVGENKVSAMGNALRIISYKTELREKEDGTRGAYVTDENAVVNMHDSGGSIFLLDEQGKPVLAGIISTYTGGSYLAAVGKNTPFPLEAATQGGRALIDALEKKEASDQAPGAGGEAGGQ